MHESEQDRWHQKPFVKVLLMLLLPLIIGGLYLISTRFALRRHVNAPITPETPAQRNEVGSILLLLPLDVL